MSAIAELEASIRTGGFREDLRGAIPPGTWVGIEVCFEAVCFGSVGLCSISPRFKAKRWGFFTQNKKQYAYKGSHVLLQANFISGKEDFIAGTTATQKDVTFQHQWLQAKFIFDTYFKPIGRYIPGIYLEAFYSAQPLFSNYTASALAAESFTPIPETRTLFMPAYRANQFLAGGVRNVYTLMKNFDLRVEGYIFQPYKEINQANDFSAFYGEKFKNRYFMGSSSLVFHSPVGPISISVNYYQNYDQPFSFLFNFGYIIYNSKGVE